MRYLSILLVALLLALAGSTNADDWGRDRCKRVSRDAQRAIEKFCNVGYSGKHKIFMTPKPKMIGKKHGRALVAITGACKPKQFIPWDICFKQFYSMCAEMGHQPGKVDKNFGRNGCQQWHIRTI